MIIIIGLNNYLDIFKFFTEVPSQYLQEAPTGLLPSEACVELHAPFGKPIHDTELCGQIGGNAEAHPCFVSKFCLFVFKIISCDTIGWKHWLV